MPGRDAPQHFLTVGSNTDLHTNRNSRSGLVAAESWSACCLLELASKVAQDDGSAAFTLKVRNRQVPNKHTQKGRKKKTEARVISQLCAQLVWCELYDMKG